VAKKTHQIGSFEQLRLSDIKKTALADMYIWEKVPDDSGNVARIMLKILTLSRRFPA
jgi:hypothetical protein